LTVSSADNDVYPQQRPRLLDLFCGAGGAAMGYHRAGFDVTGVDVESQPHFPFHFIQADALAWPLEGYHAIHASPPCQAWSRATAWSGDRSSHPKLIAPVRERLRASGLPYVIENVQEARHDLRSPIRLCGSQFGIAVQSHRWFEIRPEPFRLMPPCHHRATDASRDHGAKQTESEFRGALGCDWMSVQEARQAIPPAYTEWIGAQLLEVLQHA
jgi:DNA (cytosine-5)-methyltransferase 1